MEKTKHIAGHTHYDWQVTWQNNLTPSTGHGVMTVVIGNCGIGFAPCKEADRNNLIRLMEGVENLPETVLATGLSWEWESFPDYLDFLDQEGAQVVMMRCPDGWHVRISKSDPFQTRLHQCFP